MRASRGRIAWIVYHVKNIYVLVLSNDGLDQRGGDDYQGERKADPSLCPPLAGRLGMTDFDGATRFLPGQLLPRTGYGSEDPPLPHGGKVKDLSLETTQTAMTRVLWLCSAWAGSSGL